METLSDEKGHLCFVALKDHSYEQCIDVVSCVLRKIGSLTRSKHLNSVELQVFEQLPSDLKRIVTKHNHFSISFDSLPDLESVNFVQLYSIFTGVYVSNRLFDHDNPSDSTANHYLKKYLNVDGLKLNQNEIFLTNPQLLTELKIEHSPLHENLSRVDSSNKREPIEIEPEWVNAFQRRLNGAYKKPTIVPDILPVFLPVNIEQGRTLLNTHHIATDEPITLYSSVSAASKGVEIVKLNIPISELDVINFNDCFHNIELKPRSLLRCVFLGKYIDYNDQTTKRLIEYLKAA